MCCCVLQQAAVQLHLVCRRLPAVSLPPPFFGLALSVSASLNEIDTCGMYSLIYACQRVLRAEMEHRAVETGGPKATGSATNAVNLSADISAADLYLHLSVCR